MSSVLTLQFPVSVEWRVTRHARSTAPGKPALHVAAPTEFGGTLDGLWSPEDLLVNAVASCYAITLASVARRLRVPLHDLTVHALGDLERAGEEWFGFTHIELDVDIATDEGLEAVAERAAAVAEKKCLVGRALDIPVHARVQVVGRPVERQEAA